MKGKGKIQTFPKGKEFRLLVNVRYQTQFSALCRIGKAPFGGEVVIVYDPDERMLEFESFDAFLRANANREETIESYGAWLMDVLWDVLEPNSLDLTIHATTQVHGPATVAFSAIPTEKEQREREKKR